MSDTQASPDDERPLIPEGLVPRQRSDDPVAADEARGEPDAGGEPSAAPDEDDEDDEDDTIDVADLP